MIQLIAWAVQYRSGHLSRNWLSTVTAGLVVNFIGMAVVNEATRLAAIDVTKLYDRHHQAFQIGGLFVFVLFFALNVALMIFCLMLVRRGAKPPGTSAVAGGG